MSTHDAASTTTSAAIHGRSPRLTYHVSPVRSSIRWRITICSLTGALQHVAVGRHELGEPGRRGLHEPPAGLDRPQAAGRDLLGLQDRAGVAGAVGRVEHRLSASLHALADPPTEEHLPRDGHGEAVTVREVEHGRPGAGDGVRGHLVDRRAERLEQAAQRDVLAERDAADLVVATRRPRRPGGR